MGEFMRAGWQGAKAILSARHILMNVNREKRKANENTVKTMDDIGRGKITLVIEIQTLEKDKASALANTQTVINSSSVRGVRMRTLISEVLLMAKVKAIAKLKKKIQLHIDINLKDDIFHNHFTA